MAQEDDNNPDLGVATLDYTADLLQLFHLDADDLPVTLAISAPVQHTQAIPVAAVAVTLSAIALSTAAPCTVKLYVPNDEHRDKVLVSSTCACSAFCCAFVCGHTVGLVSAFWRQPELFVDATAKHASGAPAWATGVRSLAYTNAPPKQKEDLLASVLQLFGRRGGTGTGAAGAGAGVGAGAGKTAQGKGGSAGTAAPSGRTAVGAAAEVRDSKLGLKAGRR